MNKLKYLLEVEDQNTYAIFYYVGNDELEIKGTYILCDSIWFVEEKFKNMHYYEPTRIIQIQCMNSILNLESSGEILKTTRLYETLKKYLYLYKKKNISIKVVEERTEQIGKGVFDNNAKKSKIAI